MQISIDIISDFVCPWCFIGKWRLAQALALVHQEQPQAHFKCTWLPFFLNPGTPPEGEPYSKFMADKFGDESRVLAVQQRVADAGAAAGVHFDFERIALRPNTLQAHRLIHRFQAGGHAPEDSARLVDRLFTAYFQRGEDIGDVGVLAAIAAESGDERAAVIAYLQSGEGLDEVLALNRQVNEGGVSAVPYFVFAKRAGIAGAQSPDVLAAAIRQAMQSY